MPEIFHPKAYHAVINGDPRLAKKLRPDHFEDYKLLDEALGWLTPQQRCDAIYADWLEQINSPSGVVLLRQRDLLIQQGGLAANYLAEFAQNADDAYVGAQGGEVRIWTRPGWLLVANNGRRFTGNDLHGLSRFFANGAKITASTEEMIGKFGIGFKSCYRIGEEVWVSTWQNNDEDFCFRIPLCRKSLPGSHYDEGVLNRILNLLQRPNSRRSQDELGFCTPEFQKEWPKEINEELKRARGIGRQGSAFAVRLHTRGAAVLRDRIQGQRNQIYELCPLFLRRLRSIGLEDTTLTLVEHRRESEHDLPGIVIADCVTLETKAPNSNSRFWVLRAAKTEKPWKLALHADSNFNLSFKAEAGETTSLRDGAAYAFFPLSIPWPFRIHLHLDLPTNLDRSNWSPDNPDEEVRQQIDTAVAGLGQWLEAKHEQWRGDWSIGDLIVRVPPEARQDTDKPAQWLYEALKREVGKRMLLRTIWGGFASGRAARCVQLREDGCFAEAWGKLGALLPTLNASLSWCLETEGKPWGVTEIYPKEIIVAAENWRAKVASESRQEFSRQLFVALIGLGKAWKSEWELIFKLVVVDEQGTTFAQLCARPGGATLTPEWHSVFAQLASRTRHETWTDVVVGNDSLYGIFTRFAKPAFNPTWVDSLNVLHPALPTVKWDEFLTAEKEPCPAELVSSILGVLRVRDARDEFKPLLGVWLLGRTVPDAFKGLSLQVNSSRQSEYKERLQKWGLWEPYVAVMDETTRAGLPNILATSLREAMERGNLLTWLEEFERRHRELGNTGAVWKELYAQCVNDALEAAFTAALGPTKGKTLVSRSIETELREVLAWSVDFVSAPVWFDDNVVQKLNELRLAHLLSEVTLLKKRDLPSQRSTLARSLLEIAHVWTNHSPTPAHYAAINRLAAEIPKIERRNLPVGLGPRKREPLEKFLLLEDSDGDPNFYWLRQTRDFAEKLLPPPVSRVLAFSEVCPKAGDLKLKAPTLRDDCLAFPISAIVPDLAALAPVRTLLQSGKITEVFQHPPIELEWWENERCVAEVKNALFYYQKDTGKLFVSRLVASLDDRQIDDVLSIYLHYASQDPEVHAARQEALRAEIPLVQVYTQFRERIVRTLNHDLVKKMGYEAGYIWRELLQNAENAYASMPDPRPVDRVFEIDVVAEETERLWKVRVTNSGRRFNQVDREGHERRDIDKIISVGGERVQTAEEIGRYNLGFKSVFATTDTVEIASGGFEFQVRDLLLRYPANPAENPGQRDRPTSFAWRCSRADGTKIIGLAANASRSAHSPYLRAPYALFGRYVNRIVLRIRGTVSELKISRKAEAGAEMVSITLPTGAVENYCVLGGSCTLGVKETKHTFSCAIRLDASGVPEPIADTDRHFHLIYPTEDKAFVSYLVDGDFEPVGVDRRQLLKSKRNLSLILSAARMVSEFAMKDLAKRFSRELWLAWADVLDPKGFAEGVRANYDEGVAEGERVASDFKSELLKRVPHQGRPVAGTSLRVPTRLLRKFAAKNGSQFGINQDNWIDEKVEKRAEQLGLVPDRRLNEWVWDLPQDERLLEQVGDALHDFSDFTQIERPEMQLARDAISRRLAPVVPAASDWDLAKLIAWWKDNLDADPYTLEGHLFPWVCVDLEPGKIKDRLKYLRANLIDAASPAGKATWYRMFTFACLISAGHRTTEMEGFLTELDRHQFFALTADPKASFADVTASIFEALVQREHQNQWASGEAAHFWRRIFYDARKVHHLIYRNEFAEVFLEMSQRESFGDALPDFLRSGEIPGQRRWRGVIGQSAAAPILFIVRELRRLRIIEHDAVDSVAFFTCKPVRRVAARLQWIDPRLEEMASWNDLLKISRILHAKFASNEEARTALLPYYDIPLLALDQSDQPY